MQIPNMKSLAEEVLDVLDPLQPLLLVAHHPQRGSTVIVSKRPNLDSCEGSRRNIAAQKNAPSLSRKKGKGGNRGDGEVKMGESATKTRNEGATHINFFLS